MGSTEVGGVKINFFGHASVSIENGDKVIYIDPYVLPQKPKKADIILFTHNHYDHCANPEKILKNDTVTIGANCQFAEQNISAGDEVVVAGVKIIAVPAYNINKSFHPRGEGVGYIVEIGGKRVYHAGDTDFIPEMRKLGRIDVALLPIGGAYTMNASDAIEAARAIGAKLVIPIHYNYISGTKVSPEAFKKQLEAIGIKCEIL